VLTSTGTEKYFDAAQDVDDELDAAWGEPGDAFFEAPKPVPATPTLFDDGGEPDFAGWLSAQAAAKAKPVLPKGLKKEAPKAGMRLAAGAGAGAGAAAGAKKAVGKVVGTPRVVEAKAIDTKPKDTGEDDWGDAWT
jgi:SCY1-like protein 1